MHEKRCEANFLDSPRPPRLPLFFNIVQQKKFGGCKAHTAVDVLAKYCSNSLQKEQAAYLIHGAEHIHGDSIQDGQSCLTNKKKLLQQRQE
jgi:hypothetical protein